MHLARHRLDGGRVLPLEVKTSDGVDGRDKIVDGGPRPGEEGGDRLRVALTEPHHTDADQLLPDLIEIDELRAGRLIALEEGLVEAWFRFVGCRARGCSDRR